MAPSPSPPMEETMSYENEFYDAHPEYDFRPPPLQPPPLSLDNVPRYASFEAFVRARGPSLSSLPPPPPPRQYHESWQDIMARVNERKAKEEAERWEASDRWDRKRERDRECEAGRKEREAGDRLVAEYFPKFVYTPPKDKFAELFKSWKKPWEL